MQSSRTGALAYALAPASILMLAGACATPRVRGSTDDTFAAWRDHILPTSDERAWERIPWLPTLRDGVLAAEDAQKPLLLWVMNGHPLGCT